MGNLTESTVEQAALAWLESLGYVVKHGPDIAPGGPEEERVDCGQVVLEDRLRQALERLNPDLPLEALDDAFRSGGCYAGGPEPGGAPHAGGRGQR